jgi:hypothetical protein
VCSTPRAGPRPPSAKELWFLRRWKVSEKKREWRRELAARFAVAAAVKVLWGLLVELVIRPHE